MPRFCQIILLYAITVIVRLGKWGIIGLLFIKNNAKYEYNFYKWCDISGKRFAC